MKVFTSQFEYFAISSLHRLRVNVNEMLIFIVKQIDKVFMIVQYNIKVYFFEMHV